MDKIEPIDKYLDEITQHFNRFSGEKKLEKHWTMLKKFLNTIKGSVELIRPYLGSYKLPRSEDLVLIAMHYAILDTNLWNHDFPEPYLSEQPPVMPKDLRNLLKPVFRYKHPTTETGLIVALNSQIHNNVVSSCQFLLYDIRDDVKRFVVKNNIAFLSHLDFVPIVDFVDDPKKNAAQIFFGGYDVPALISIDYSRYNMGLTGMALVVHEYGHHLIQCFKRHLQSDLNSLIRRTVKNYEGVWGSWTQELFGDVMEIAILKEQSVRFSGHLAIDKDTLKEGTNKISAENSSHPFWHIRVIFAARVLRALGFGKVTEIEKSERKWISFSNSLNDRVETKIPSTKVDHYRLGLLEMSDFIQDVDRVADAMVNEKLFSLYSHSLKEMILSFKSGLADDIKEDIRKRDFAFEK